MKAYKANDDTAEARFREAFDRLKAGSPKILPVGASVSQNNVAKEAGCCTSALRKSRFPSLIREIQAFVEIRDASLPLSVRQQHLRKREIEAQSRERLAEVIAQRDAVQSRLLSAHRAVLELQYENALLKTRINALVVTASGSA